jgi:hypothetical protein
MVALAKEIESERMAMNTFNSQRSLTLGQIELYLLFALALAGVITKTLATLTRTGTNIH